MAKIDLEKLICSLAKRKYFSEEKLQNALKEQGLEYKDGKIVQTPKFNVGDWIIRSAKEFKHSSFLVKEIKDYYICEDLKGRRVVFTTIDVEENFSLWTIQDAKDGDVLAVPPIKGSEHSEQIFIFKEIKDREYVKNAVEYYCRCMDNKFASNERGFMGQSDDYFTPATKEQRDLLFQKMKEAGYEWDADKKELRKIPRKETLKSKYPNFNADAMVGKYSNTELYYDDGVRFGKPIPCMIRAYRKGIEDTLKELNLINH